MNHSIPTKIKFHSFHSLVITTPYFNHKNHKTKNRVELSPNPFIPEYFYYLTSLHPPIFVSRKFAPSFFPPIPYTKRCRCFCPIGQEFCWKNSVTNRWLFLATHIRGIHRSDRWIHVLGKRDSRVDRANEKPQSKRDLRFHGLEFMAVNDSNGYWLSSYVIWLTSRSRFFAERSTKNEEEKEEEERREIYRIDPNIIFLGAREIV